MCKFKIFSKLVKDVEKTLVSASVANQSTGPRRAKESNVAILFFWLLAERILGVLLGQSRLKN